jgi:hypothetical protein
MAWFLFSLAVSAWVHGSEIVSVGVAQIRQETMTSREVNARTMVHNVLAGLKVEPLVSVDSKAFSKILEERLIERVVALEAQSLNLASVSAEEIDRGVQTATRSLSRLEAWRRLQISPAELQAFVETSLVARRFIEFRARSSVLPVTDAEALKHFNENRLKFGDLPFDHFKENIKNYLSRTQVDRRLKEWYGILFNKYQVKNILAEQ